MKNELAPGIKSALDKYKQDVITVEALKGSMATLTELSNSGESMFKVIQAAENRNITLQRIVQNAKQGGVFNTDYYLVNFKDKIAEIKTAKFLITLIYKYSVSPVMEINYFIVFKGEKVSVQNNRYTKDINFEIDNTKYDDVIGGVAEILFTNGGRIYTQMSKKDFDKIRDCSPSKSGPWSTWPIRMCENKIVKELFKKVPLDKMKMLESGYHYVEDEVVLKDEVVGDDVIVVEDKIETRKVYDEDKIVAQDSRSIKGTQKNKELLEAKANESFQQKIIMYIGTNLSYFKEKPLTDLQGNILDSRKKINELSDVDAETIWITLNWKEDEDVKKEKN